MHQKLTGHIICLSDPDRSRFDGLLAFYIFLRKESHFRKCHYGSLPNGTEYYSRQYYLSISDRKCTADHFSRMYMWCRYTGVRGFRIGNGKNSFPDQYFDPAAYDLYQQAYPAVCIYLHDEPVFIR